MTRRLEGRVAVVTGAGRGLGAAYALALADHGAKVVLNDLGAGLQGEKIDEDPVVQVAEAIRAKGGEAVIDRGDVADFDAAGQLIETALSSFGALDILINNAGILRDRMLVNMTVQEWDDVIRVHLRGHFCPTQHAAVHWRERAKQGKADAVLIHTTSIAGLHGNAGQANYSTAKSGLATLAYLNHLELHARYGVRAYAIAPNARTRLTLNSPGAADLVREPEAGTFDYFSPDNVAAFVAWLGAADCAAPSGTIYGVEGGLVRRYDAWHIATSINNGDKRWTFEELDARVDELAAGHERTFTPLSEILIAPGQAPRA